MKLTCACWKKVKELTFLFLGAIFIYKSNLTKWLADSNHSTYISNHLICTQSCIGHNASRWQSCSSDPTFGISCPPSLYHMACLICLTYSICCNKHTEVNPIFLTQSYPQTDVFVLFCSAFSAYAAIDTPPSLFH